MEEEEESIWICSTCGQKFTVEGNGREHIRNFRHGVLYRRTIVKRFNPSSRKPFFFIRYSQIKEGKN